MVLHTPVPTHHTLFFRIRLYPTASTTENNAIVHTPIFSCTLSRTTALPILCGGPHDPFLSLLKLTDGAGVALLIDGKAVRTREQITRLVAIGRFGRKPGAVPIGNGSALKLVASTKKRKIPVFDILYLEQKDVDEDNEDIHASSSASSLSSSSSASSSGSLSPTQSSSLLKRFIRRSKVERKLASAYPDMEGATVHDTELLLRRAGLRVPRSLRLQVRELVVKQQQHEQQTQYGWYSREREDISPDRSSIYSSCSYASSVASSASTVSTGSFDERRSSIIFSVGPDDGEEPLFWDDEREDLAASSKRPRYYQPQQQYSKQGYIFPTNTKNVNPLPYMNYAQQQQQLYQLHQLQAQRMQQQLGHRKGSSLSSQDNGRRLARIYEEDEE
ncbi:hypothetical protein V1520DRAFT_346962 [Lipomyces starkeyi]|uniref:Uncharacterized protein n=1 Tax=Lipomyces starkeyi NRRL Y-11557 TaxID=675824 RepID=A0A1E3QF46_LIPST|nr:hypothetical protein LIPSTDRAFT_66936 [Lipomyces starkeyi NRRL Y-11557]